MTYDWIGDNEDEEAGNVEVNCCSHCAYLMCKNTHFKKGARCLIFVIS
jgi:hypothetical protein